MKIQISLPLKSLCASLLLTAAVAPAQTVSYTTPGAIITENFDTMGTGGTVPPAGWFTGSLGTVANAGQGALPNNVDALLIQNGGDGTVGRNFNCGVLGVNPLADRALGAAGTTASERGMEVRIKNNTGFPIDTITYTVSFEVWRGSGNAITTGLTNRISTNGVNFVNTGNAFNFWRDLPASAVALDGNAAANRSNNIGGTIVLSTPLTNGGTLYIRWYKFNDAGADPTIAIDDFSFSATVVGGSSPFITLTSPANGASAFVPATINLASSASGGSGTVTNVAYYYTNSGSVFYVGTSASGPTYPVSTTPLPAGTYGFYAISTNTAGITNSLTNVVTVIPPLTSLTFLQQPSTQLAGAVIAPEIQVGATNSLGAAIPGLPVSLSLNGGGVLGGTTTQNTDGSGIAHFANLTVSTVGSKTLVATNAGSLISGTSASFTITNAPPSVALTNNSGDSFLVGTFILLGANASDTDGTVTSVSFYANGRFLGSDTAAPYRLNFDDLTAGTHSLVAVALDNSGNNATSAPVSITVTNEPGYTYLITNGAPWKYLDTGINLGDSGSGTNLWIGTGFDDSLWSVGNAEFGYGNNGEDPTRPAVTTVSFGLDGANKYITTYFRKQFTVANPAGYTNLVLKLMRDDGALIYINGVEVIRTNMPPTGPIGYQTNALTATGGVDEYTFESHNVSPASLVAGANTIAVEIHQQGAGSSDISFDLQLLAQGNVQVPIVIGAPVYNAGGNQLTLTWSSVPGATYAIDNSSDITTPLASWDTLSAGIASQGATTTNVINNPAPGTFYIIRKQP